MQRRSFLITLIGVFVASVALRALIPPNPVYGSIHDDQLLVQLARNIMDGKWLGSYQELGHLALSKPPGYSIFLASSHFIPWSPTLTVHLLLLAGALMFVRELMFLEVSRVQTLICFSLIAFFPIWFNEQMSRIYRDGFMASLTMWIIAFTMMSSRAINIASNEKRFRANVGIKVFLTAIATGLVLGYFIITKPSWHFLIAFIVTYLLTRFHINRHNAKIVVSWVGVWVAVFSISAIVPSALVRHQNAKHYDLAVVDTFSSGSFVEALNALYGVEDKQNRPYVDVTLEMRQKVYRISPTFRKLEPYLELPDGVGWRAQPCSQPLAVCDESAGWFPWDLRDAVQAAGLGDTAVEFDRTMQKIAKDIRQGCEAKTIRCEHEGIAPGLDSLDSLSPRVVLDTMSNGFRQLMNPFSGYSERGVATNISSEVMSLWSSTINGLPANELATRYQSDDAFLGDTRWAMGEIYGRFWMLLFLIGVATILRPLNKNPRGGTRALSFAALVALCVIVFQLSLLQASSGFYMTSGGPTYLLSAYPFVLVVVSCGFVSFSRFMSSLRGSSRS